MRDLPSTLVFDRADARACGWTDSAFSRAVSRGRVLTVRRNVFCRPGVSHAAIATLAAARACRDSVISHRSGGLFLGIPVVGGKPDRPELTVRPSGTGDVLGAHLHRATLLDTDVIEVDGVLITSPARTAFDIARSRPVQTGVAALDFVLHNRWVTRAELDDLAIRCWNWPGIRRAVRAIDLADYRAESPLESVSRLTMRWLRLPTPDPNPDVFDRYGRFIGRTDFYWDEVGCVGEADGRSKYDMGGDVLAEEKARQELLEDESIAVVRWGWSQVTQRPQQFRVRLEAAYERGRARDRSGLPRYWSVRSQDAGRPGENRRSLIAFSPRLPG